MMSETKQPTMSRRAREAQPFRAMVFGERADEMIARSISVIKLSLGEPDFGAPPAVRDAMREQYDGRALPYTAALGLPELRRAIADFYHERHHVDIDPRRIVITAGGSAALLLATALTVDPGDEVIVADPSYPCNRELIRSFEGVVVDVPTSAATRFHLNAELVDRAWSERTKAVMVTSPSNPTGTTIDFDVLKGVCDLARFRGAWRIIDETYLDLADREPDGSEVRSALLADPDAIICNSFSKFFGMTGWRLGWAVVPEYTIGAVDDLATNYYLCAHTPTQHAALACFTPESLAVCEERRQELLARRRIVVSGLGAHQPAARSGSERRVLRVFQRRGNRFGRVDVLRACAGRGACGADSGTGFRPGDRGHACAAVLRGVARGVDGGAVPARKVRRLAAMILR